MTLTQARIGSNKRNLENPYILSLISTRLLHYYKIFALRDFHVILDLLSF
jgi:hypothetical protein